MKNPLIGPLVVGILVITASLFVGVVGPLLHPAEAAPATTECGTYVTQVRIFADYDITIGNTAEQSDLKLAGNINQWIKDHPQFQIQKVDQCPGPYNKFVVQYLAPRRQLE